MASSRSPNVSCHAAVTRYKGTHPALTPARQAGTWFELALVFGVWCLVTYQDVLPVYRLSSIQLVVFWIWLVLNHP